MVIFGIGSMILFQKIRWYINRRFRMDNLTILVLGVAVFIVILLVGEALAKFFDWKE